MNLHVVAKRLVPGFESRLLLRRIVNFPRDTFDNITGRRDPLIPPHGLWFIGGEEDYVAVNEEFMRYFVQLCGLKRGDHVLDVGCGIGVTAARLTKFLNAEGSYDGFDIVKAGIYWATNHITKRFPNFRFVHADVFNKHYNPKGKLEPENFAFPYEDAQVDFVILKSVFTHLRPAAIQHYLREVRRVLKPTGSCLATAFLMNACSRELIRSGRSSIELRHDLGDYFVLDPKFPETAVGVWEHDFKEWCEAAGLGLVSPIHYGHWCGREHYMSYQDFLVLRPSLPVSQ